MEEEIKTYLRTRAERMHREGKIDSAELRRKLAEIDRGDVKGLFFVDTNRTIRERGE